MQTINIISLFFLLPVLNIVSTGRECKRLKHLRQGNIFMRNETNIVARRAHNSNRVLDHNRRSLEGSNANVVARDKEVISSQRSVPIRILRYQPINVCLNNHSHILIRCSLAKIKNKASNKEFKLYKKVKIITLPRIL